MSENQNIHYFTEKIRDTKACGYCHSKKHKGRLTVKMLKQHQCLRKQCPLLERYEEHPYWREKARIKAIKQAKKQLGEI